MTFPRCHEAGPEHTRRAEDERREIAVNSAAEGLSAAHQASGAPLNKRPQHGKPIIDPPLAAR